MSFFVCDVVSLQKLSTCNLCMSSNSIMVIIFYFDEVRIGYQRLELNSLPPHHALPTLPPALQKKNQHLKGNNNHVRWWSHTYMYFPYFQYQVKITCGWIVHSFFFLRYLQDDPKRGTKHTINWWVWVASSLNNWWVVVQVLQGLNNNWWICTLPGWTIGGWWCGCFKVWTAIDGSARF
jgi:hypothetical protein